jgi:hypothetical protein
MVVAMKYRYGRVLMKCLAHGDRGEIYWDRELLFDSPNLSVQIIGQVENAHFASDEPRVRE